MGYSRNYTGYINYSGTVNYPASQNGGSMRYSGTETVYVTINVDTDMFESSVIDCNQSIGGLTTAVVATEAAQIASKKKTSDKITKAIIGGFFEYVGADLSQKTQELTSQCESLVVELMGHKASCIAKSTQMQEDYNRITKRYLKIFEDLDKEVHSRIETLDKPIFHFADSAQKLIDRNVDTDLLGISTVSANENSRMETILVSSHIKQIAKTVLSKATDYLQGTYRLAHSVRDMLIPKAADGELMLPIIYTESVLESGNIESKLQGPDTRFTPSGKEMDAQLKSRFKAKDIVWEDMNSEEYDKVMTYMNAYIQNSQMDERTLKTMLGLIRNKGIQIIKPEIP